jgi:hypothetical protein
MTIMDFSKKYLGGLKPTEVKPELVEEQGAYLIVRLVERAADDVVYELVTYRKSDYAKWFEGQLKNLKGEVVDPEIRLLLQEKLKDGIYGRWLFGQLGG